MCDCIERIVLKIREAGFNIVAQKDTQLTKDQAEELYDTSKDKEYFGELVQSVIRFNECLRSARRELDKHSEWLFATSFLSSVCLYVVCNRCILAKR